MQERPRRRRSYKQSSEDFPKRQGVSQKNRQQQQQQQQKPKELKLCFHTKASTVANAFRTS